ncbi:MAG: META domain-containing protein [Methylovulum sp.]|uniref:META domain-containing protein n=1 Tax=Methylovulum sp. TaxID=1916980 RepID=UPI00261BB010|nr:META domain-containing protein [Methylovulum sp.]MDD2724939.1 META domain-containing protein [Methylovulum sp.]MDD5123538.1 META domain-containing protein [Methylovulum sp.]
MKIFQFIFLASVFTSVGCSSSKTTDLNPAAPKLSAALTGIYWKLTELNGESVADAKGSGRREIFMLLDEDGRVSGNGGCNGFGGTFKTSGDGFRLTFSQLIGTQMACPDMSLESRLFKVLEATDSYYVNHNELQLIRARMAPLAKFIAIPDKK